MRAAADLQLQLTLDSNLISDFYPLLQRGVWLPVTIGCSVMKLLNSQLGIAEAYVLDRITTLFLDGKAIDDLTSSYVENRSTLALSTAMPGLVGSTMRRGGHLAAMRGEITYHPSQAVATGAGTVKIKLFNMLMKEVGPLLLEKGILLSGAELITFLAAGGSSLQNGCGSVTLDGLPLPCAELFEQLPARVNPQQMIFVKVIWQD